MMLGQLLNDTWREAAWVVDGATVSGGFVKKDGKKVEESTGQPAWADEHMPPDGKKDKMGSVLSDRLKWHLQELVKRDGEVEKEIKKEEAEQKKKITSEDITEGFSATSLVKESAPSPIENKGIKEPKKPKKKEQTIEVLNPGAVSQGALCQSTNPQLTSSHHRLRMKIPIRKTFPTSDHFLQLSEDSLRYLLVTLRDHMLSSRKTPQS